MKKLWQGRAAARLSNKAPTGATLGLDTDVETYTVGRDYILDQEIILFDIHASRAHAKMLQKIGILSAPELATLLRGFDEITKLVEAGKFSIDLSHEDCHTAIELYLTEKFGEAGKKIHTGRSRNDQILTALRLFSKAKLAEMEKMGKNLVQQFRKISSRESKTLMPGYTHMQRAMPTTVGVWLESFADALQDDLTMVAAAGGVLDQNPLGSAAGFGENIFGLDREFTAKEMGFRRVQKNPMYCGASRGKFELIVLQAFGLIMMDLGKFATDLLLFTTKEFDFFSLPDEFRTGSSIMPQKKNYDVLELMRGSVSIFLGFQFQIQEVIKNLPSGYNRDFQLTKEPFLRGVRLALDTANIAQKIISNLRIHKSKLAAACTDELYATERAYRLVKKGMNFRDAYHTQKL